MSFEQTTSDGNLERLIKSGRHASVKEGGRDFKYSACVVVGDGKGRIGFSKRSAREISIAMPKALERARRNMLHINIHKDTIYHRVEATYGATKVIILPARNTGIIAGQSMRPIFEVLGIKHVVAKIIGSRNAINVLRATLQALEQINTPEGIKAKKKRQEA